MLNITQGTLFILYLLFLWVPTKKALLLYQQNRYQMQRYDRSLKDELCYHKEHLENICALLGVYVLLFARKEDLPCLFIMLLLMYVLVLWRKEDTTAYRKPLVYTHRVKRYLCICYVCYGLIVFYMLQIFQLYLMILLFPFFYLLPWLLLIPLGIALLPLEKQIQSMYMKEAKQLLQQHQNLHIIGITGSYGKTSVKHILYQLIAQQYYTLMTPHSYNNKMGITLTIRKQLQSLHEVFLCEMGADHVHEISALMGFVKPSWSIVTAIGPQHLSTFQTMEHIVHEKMQAIECLPKDGIGFLNIDNAWIREYPIQNTCRIVTYGTHAAADYRIKDIVYSKQGASFKIHVKGVDYAFHTKLLGKHNVVNIAAGIAVAHCLGIELSVLQELTKHLPYVEHRLQLRPTSSYTMLDDAYNSNVEGATYALEVLAKMEGKHIVVTPGFLDLGDMEENAHVRLGKQLAQVADEVILVGQHQSKHIVKGLQQAQYDSRHVYVCENIQEAFELLKQLATKDSVVLFENDLPDAFNH